MDELSAALKIVLSNTFVMYQKAQIYHWNVEGPMFAQYHDFFADIYGELLPAIDIAAEQMRALDTYNIQIFKMININKDSVNCL